jgi:hypothetical protein
VTEKTSFADRFRRLEIPEDRRRFDGSFLDERLRLPAPLPYEDLPLVALLHGRALEAQDEDPAGPDSPRIHLSRQFHALRELDAPPEAERRWHERNRTALDAARKRFYDTVPASVLRDPALLDEAVRLLDGLDSRARASGGRDAEGGLTLLLGDARLLRIHGKLYNLVTLRDYVRVFASAIEPSFLTRLTSFPETVTPEELLGAIEGSLDSIHAKARSPLRNKMSTCRIVLDGVTYLPIYREPAAGLFESYGRLLDARVKLGVLKTKRSGN